MRTVRGSSGTRRGFSALELVIVILIMGMLVTLAMPYLISTLRQSALDGSADNLMSAFSSARSQALGGNTFSKIVVDEAGNRLTIYLYSPEANSWNDTGQGMELLQGISFAPGGIILEDSSAIFDPHGSLVNGGSITIQDSQGNTLTLSTLLATGRLTRT